MRLGFMVDGDAELGSLPALLVRALEPTAHRYTKTLIARTHADQPTHKVVAACRPALLILEKSGADVAVAVFDLENPARCPGQRADELRVEIQRATALEVRVVLKVLTLENWIVADPRAVGRFSARFQPAVQIERQVEPNRADHVDAVGLLRRAATRKSYSKVPDAKKVLEVADPLRMGANSRSFRRLLRVIDHPSYAAQSRCPVR